MSTTDVSICGALEHMLRVQQRAQNACVRSPWPIEASSHSIATSLSLNREEPVAKSSIIGSLATSIHGELTQVRSPQPLPPPRAACFPS